MEEAGAARTGWPEAVGMGRTEITDGGHVIERCKVQGKTIRSDHQVGSGDLCEQVCDGALSVSCDLRVVSESLHSFGCAVDNDRVCGKALSQAANDPCPLFLCELPGAPAGFSRA